MTRNNGYFHMFHNIIEQASREPIIPAKYQKEVNGMKENMNGTPQIVNRMGRDKKVWLCIEIRDGQTKTYPTKEQLKKEGCKWTTNGISSSWNPGS